MEITKKKKKKERKKERKTRGKREKKLRDEEEEKEGGRKGGRDKKERRSITGENRFMCSLVQVLLNHIPEDTADGLLMIHSPIKHAFSMRYSPQTLPMQMTTQGKSTPLLTPRMVLGSLRLICTFFHPSHRLIGNTCVLGPPIKVGLRMLP